MFGPCASEPKTALENWLSSNNTLKVDLEQKVLARTMRLSKGMPGRPNSVVSVQKTVPLPSTENGMNFILR